MSFAQPFWLALGLVVLALGVGYLIAQRRTRRHTLRFANLELLEKVAPRRPGRWRHVPIALILVGLVLLTVALAGPTADTKEPRNRATVMLAIDVSLSMEATDVAPNRLAAAQEAATQFVEDLTPGVNLGIVSFAGYRDRAGQPDHRPQRWRNRPSLVSSWTSARPPARRSSPACRPSICSPNRSREPPTAAILGRRRPGSC